MTVSWSDRITGAHLDHPFADPEWLTAWWASFGTGSLQVAKTSSGAALPLSSRGRRLIATANYHSPVFAPATEDEAVAQELLRAAFTRREAEVLLYPLPEGLLPLV